MLVFIDLMEAGIKGPSGPRGITTSCDIDLPPLRTNLNIPADITLAKSMNSGSQEAESSDSNPRYWKCYHQDLFDSKWYKALLWLILAATSSASVLVLVFFANGLDVFDYDGLYCWMFCIVPLSGVIFVWVPGGAFFSKVFRPI